MQTTIQGDVVGEGPGTRGQPAVLTPSDHASEQRAQRHSGKRYNLSGFWIDYLPPRRRAAAARNQPSRIGRASGLPHSETRLVKRDQLKATVASGEMSRTMAISDETGGSQHIYTAVSRIPPGLSRTPHVLTSCESSLYAAARQRPLHTG